MYCELSLSKILRNACVENWRYLSDVLFERRRLRNNYDLNVCELLKYAVHSTRGKIEIDSNSAIAPLPVYQNCTFALKYYWSQSCIQLLWSRNFLITNMAF